MIYNPIGETLVRLLKRHNISQSTLALRMDVSDTTVSRWVNGTRPRADQWPRILRGIGCTRFDFEVELTRVMCEHCEKRARELGEAVPVFGTSSLMRQVESVAALDLEPVGEPARPALRRLRDVVVTVATQCEPLLRELEEVCAGSAAAAPADGG